MKTTYGMFKPMKGEKAPDPVRPGPEPWWQIDHVSLSRFEDTLVIIWTWSNVSDLVNPVLDTMKSSYDWNDTTDMFPRTTCAEDPFKQGGGL